MRNLLDCIKPGIAKDHLKIAAKKLLAAGMNVDPLPDGDLIDFKTTKRDETWHKVHAVFDNMGSHEGLALNLREDFERYYWLAVDERYNFNDDHVCERFGYFLLAMTTENFDESDNSDTSHGHQGEISVEFGDRY